MILPDFLGIGAQRCGTTWLHTQLSTHSEIYVPHERKEIHYFDRYFDRGPEWYARFFEGGRGKRIGEVTPNYLENPEVSARIKATLPDSVFLVMLRNPAERAFSQYKRAIRDVNERGTFEQYVAAKPGAFERGLYYERLSRYLKYFPRDRFLVLLLEEVVKEPHASLRRVASFLGVDPEGFSSGSDARSGRNEAYRVRVAGLYAFARRFGIRLRRRDMDWLVNLAKTAGLKRLFGRVDDLPPFDPETRLRLLARYEQDMATLETLFELDLSLWRP